MIDCWSGRVHYCAGLTLCGSVGRRFRGASVGEPGQRRLEEVFVFGFSDGILLNNTLLL